MGLTVSNRTVNQERFTRVLCDVMIDEKSYTGFSVNGKRTQGRWTKAEELYRAVTQALAEVDFDKLYECRCGKNGKNTAHPFFVEAETAPGESLKGCCGDIVRYMYDQRVWHVGADGKKYFLNINLLTPILMDQLWYYADHMGVDLEIECEF